MSDHRPAMIHIILKAIRAIRHSCGAKPQKDVVVTGFAFYRQEECPATKITATNVKKS